MYMVPHKIPAPSAAAIPREACAAGPAAVAADATASSHAPKHITKTPPSTPAHRRAPAFRSSLKKINPHKIPSKLFEFQSGNAMLNPTSRIAKIVSVFATAQMHPAKIAHINKCGVRFTSARIDDVPKISAGTLHRARKTPITIITEITTGEIPTVTSFVGASAAPNQAPAVNPDTNPTTCSAFARVPDASLLIANHPRAHRSCRGAARCAPACPDAKLHRALSFPFPKRGCSPKSTRSAPNSLSVLPFNF